MIITVNRTGTCIGCREAQIMKMYRARFLWLKFPNYIQRSCNILFQIQGWLRSLLVVKIYMIYLVIKLNFQVKGESELSWWYFYGKVNEQCNW
jgi:hypothetical protein